MDLCKSKAKQAYIVRLSKKQKKRGGGRGDKSRENNLCFRDTLGILQIASNDARGHQLLIGLRTEN